MENFSTLSDRKILQYLKSKKIVIDPLKRENINTSSVDVTLGEYYFREQSSDAGKAIYSPWSEIDVRSVWGEAQKAEKAGIYAKRNGFSLPEGIKENDKVIWIRPGETILGHTNEFIGGAREITTMMKARSTLGRNFIEVCKCAGWGDVGYINRWTMEITNNSRHYIIPLVVGRRVAQIIFFEVGEITQEDYSKSGKYQNSLDLSKLKKDWTPDSMLPKMWKDREIR